jgi:hypothetical protein
MRKLEFGAREVGKQDVLRQMIRPKDRLDALSGRCIRPGFSIPWAGVEFRARDARRVERARTESPVGYTILRLTLCPVTDCS